MLRLAEAFVASGQSDKDSAEPVVRKNVIGQSNQMNSRETIAKE